MIQSFTAALGYVIILFITVAGSLFYYFKSSPNLKSEESAEKRNSKRYEITIMLGSGGHTGEMSQMFQGFRFKDAQKMNVITASTDKSSRSFFSKTVLSNVSEQTEGKIQFYEIPRTNEVKQSKLSSVFSTLKSIFFTISLIRNHLMKTTHYVANGPGSCVPFFLLFTLLNKLRITSTKRIFVESWCRVTSISLTGKIVRHLSDRFIVHFEEQQQKFKWTEWIGRII